MLLRLDGRVSHDHHDHEGHRRYLKAEIEKLMRSS
jgi:hypothetical protein